MTMLNPFATIEHIEARVFTSLPSRFRRPRRTAWSDANRRGAELECFLEGPAFDRQGRLWLVDIPHGRVFRVSPDGEWTLVTEYDGWPNGLKLHRDGRVFLCDYKNGLMVLDPATGKVEPLLESVHTERFKGLNDLHFASNGDLYFTDQGQTGAADPTGRVFRLRADGRLDRLVGNAPSPNGISLSNDGRTCFVAMTRSQQIWRLPIMGDGSISKAGVAVQLSGGTAGPDGIEVDADDGLLVCHLGIGVWRFDATMLPTHVIRSPRHRQMGNLAFGGADLASAYIPDATTGDVLVARLPAPGKRPFGLR